MPAATQSGSLSFVELASKILAEERRPLSAGEIWRIAEERGYVALLRVKTGSRESKKRAGTLHAILGDKVRMKGSSSDFVRVEENGAVKYYLRSLVLT